jgi:hypothetical protein
LKTNKKVIPHIPNGARIASADALAGIVQQALENPSRENWAKLLLFGYIALASPSVETINKTCQRQPSYATRIKSQIANYVRSDSIPNHQFAHPHARTVKKASSEESRTKAMSKRVSAKLSDMDIRGAIRALCSEDDVADCSADVIETLKTKHPPSPEDLQLPPPPDDNMQGYSPTEQEVTAALASFPPGSLAGLDGVRPAHLKEMMSLKAGEAGARFRSALTALVDKVLKEPFTKNPLYYEN